MRLALHECDPAKIENCASSPEIADYFRKNVISMQMKKVKPNLKNYETYPPLYNSFEYSYYSVREQADLIYGREIFIQQSSMELTDDRLGFYDDPITIDLLEWKQTELIVLKESDPMNLHHTQYLQYWNILLSEDQTHYERTQYSILDVLEETGGLISILFPILVLFLEPCLAKKNHIKVFKEYQK